MPFSRTTAVVVHSIGVCMVYTSVNTGKGIAQRSIQGYRHELSNTTTPYTGIDAYTAFGALNIFIAIFGLWLSPLLIKLLGNTRGMVVGTLGYAFFIASFLHPMTWSFIVASICMGITCPILWAGQGGFITDMSTTDKERRRNVGIFWGIYQLSMILGNLYLFIVWKGITEIGSQQRIKAYTIFTACVLIGTLVFTALHINLQRNPLSRYHQGTISSSEDRNSLPEKIVPISDSEASADEPLDESGIKEYLAEFTQSSRDIYSLWKTKHILLLCITFAYTGTSMALMSAVMPTWIGTTKIFGYDSDRLIGINGIVLGVGQIFGSLVFSMLPNIAKRFNIWHVFVYGCVLHGVAYFLIWGNFTDDVVSGTYYGASLWYPRYWITVVISFISGLGDCCINVAIWNHVSAYYKQNSAPAFSIFKALQSLANACGFFYGGVLSIHHQMIICITMLSLSIVTFTPILIKSDKFLLEDKK